MNKKVMSSMWGPSGPVLWDQPARQTTLALSPLCANLCPDQFVQQASAAARVVRPVDCGRLHRSPTGHPEWVQPPDAPSADHVLVRPAPALLTCWLGVSLPAVRRHDSVSPQRRLCRDGCGPLCRGRGRPRHGGRPRPPTAVLHNAGSPRISPPQRHGGRQPPPAPPVGRRSAFNTVSSIFTAKGSVGVADSPNAGMRNTSGLFFAKSWRSTPSQTGTDSWLRGRTGSTGTGRGWRGPPRRDGSSVISSALAACCWPPCRTCFTILMIQRFRNRPTP